MILITILVVVGALILTAQCIIGLGFLVSSIAERERRASRFALVQFIGMTALLAFFVYLGNLGFFHTTLGVILLLLGYLAAGLAAYFLLRESGVNPRALQGTQGSVVGEVERFDERAQVFARNRAMTPDPDQRAEFYAMRPEMEAYDDKRRERGGPLGRLGTIDRPHEGPNVAATLAALTMPLYLSTPDKVRPKASPLLPQDLDLGMSPEEASRRVKGFARKMGADLVGIAKIDPLWVYSKRGEIFHGNWEEWGKELPMEHTYAVVMAEEMDFEMVGPAPHTPSVMESMKNYAQGAYLSTVLAAYIANLGYDACANHLRHYTAILPPLAVDAGLGEVGRLGYLLTKEFGPRIRLSAVTTSLPLIPDKPQDIGVEDFCRICKKCAITCPSQSIPRDSAPAEHNGTRRWKMDAESCFDYWSKIGTDCCICMRVCPWSHARTWPHRLIVRLISRNSYARRIFSVMDDIFYGKKPKSKQPPAWARFS